MAAVGRGVASLLAVLAFAGATATPVAAQYFGRNKVQYDAFDFRVLETPHFDIYYYPAEHDAVVEAGKLAERWYARLSRALGHEFSARQPIVLYSSHAQFTQTNVVSELLGDGVGGLTEHLKGRVVLPFAAGLGETDHVLGHELVHAFQRDILRGRGRSMAFLPLWFVEGMAEYLSVGHIDPQTAMWLRDAADEKRLPSIRDLDNPRWFPYRYGQGLWAYLASRFGDDVVARALQSNARGGALGRLAAATGVDIDSLSRDWHRAIRETLLPAPLRLPLHSRVVAGGTGSSGRLNVSPALSPDGKDLVFISERDHYSMDVFLADAETGTVKRVLVRTAGNSHYDSLQFIESAGQWDSSGRRFALAALSAGQPVVTIFDMPGGSVEREIRLPQFDQVFSPSWAPDGSRLAFSGLSGGFSDLYVFNLETGSCERLTSDAFADLQPSWSPDGRTIAFSTDRFSSSLEALAFGNLRLAAIDVATGALRALPGLPSAKHINPQWAGDGSIFFVADGDGVSNVYRLSVETGVLTRVTDAGAGVSGVGALSPALSVARDSGSMAFSMYRRGRFEIRSIAGDKVSLLAAANVVTGESAVAVPRPVVAAEPFSGSHDFTVKPYPRGLSLDGIGQPYLSAGGGSFGGFFRVGTTLSFGDMLGDRTLQTSIQVGTRVDDFAVQTAYINQRSRWNWGIAGSHVPWLIASTGNAAFQPSSDGTLTRDAVLYRQLHRQLSGIASYPFNGARRAEFGAGVHLISFERETTRSVYSGATGALISEATSNGLAAARTMLFETRAALVHDTTVFGPAGPVLGERYRLEVAPTFGGLTFTTVTADVRKYMMPVSPFTVALRALHAGRYGPDSLDGRLLPLLGSLRDVVRGYSDLGPVSTRSCRSPVESDCASLGYLSSNIFAGSAELRFPLAGAFNGEPVYGRLPLEALLFLDAGAFRRGSSPSIPTSTTKLLRSAGAGVRLNVTGMVFELGLARSHDGPASGWTFLFNLRPGF